MTRSTACARAGFWPSRSTRACLPRDIDRILDNCVYGSVKFLYIAPERIDSELFRTRFGKMRVFVAAVDEAQCICPRGYDFRPSYLRIARLRELQPTCRSSR